MLPRQCYSLKVTDGKHVVNFDAHLRLYANHLRLLKSPVEMTTPQEWNL